MKKIKFYLKKNQIVKDETIIQRTDAFLKKAKNNLITMGIFSELSANKKLKDLLKIPDSYNSDEWIVIAGYYAMYSAALSLIAKIGYRSKNHNATLFLLEEFYVRKEILNEKEFLLIKNAILKKEELEKISDAKQKREIAQYSVTKKTTKEIAEKIKKDAYEFVAICEKIIEELK